MPDKGKNTKRGAPKQAAAQGQNPASDKDAISPDTNESNDPNDVQTGPAAAAFHPPKEEKATQSALTEESKEGTAASEMLPTKEEIKPESAALDVALALGKEPGTEETDTTEGSSLPVMMTTVEPTAKPADKEETTSATGEPIVDVEVEDDKEHGNVVKQSLGEAVVDESGLPSDATHDYEMMSDDGSKDSQQITDNKDTPKFGSPAMSSEVIGQSAVTQETDSKRASEDQSDNVNRTTPKKRFRSARDIEVRMLIPSRVFRLFMGKGGENIEMLRSSWNVDLSIPDSKGAPEGILVISGDRNVVCNSLPEVILFAGLMSSRQPLCHEIRFLVVHDLVTILLSNGGTRLQSVQQDTGGQIRFFIDDAPFSVERVLEVTGTALQISQCMSALIRIMAEVPQRHATAQYNPKNFDEINVSGYGGYTDKRGLKHQGDQRRSDVDKVRNAKVFLSHDLARAILGADGNRIMEVRKESGAKIRLKNPSCEGSVERVISITGTVEQIQYAQYLLQIILRQHFETAP